MFHYSVIAIEADVFLFIFSELLEKNPPTTTTARLQIDSAQHSSRTIQIFNMKKHLLVYSCRRTLVFTPEYPTPEAYQTI